MPFKIWVFLLFSKHPTLSRQSGAARVQLTAFAKRLHVSKARLVEHLEWLEREGLISELKITEDKVQALFYLTLPPDSQWRKGEPEVSLVQGI